MLGGSQVNPRLVLLFVSILLHTQNGNVAGGFVLQTGCWLIPFALRDSFKVKVAAVFVVVLCLLCMWFWQTYCLALCICVLKVSLGCLVLNLEKSLKGKVFNVKDTPKNHALP